MQHAEQGKQVAARDLPTKGAGMSDIVERLRNWRTVHLARLHLLMEEAADEMERLRADWPEQLQAHSVLIAEQELEIARLRALLSRTGSDAEKTGGDAAEYRKHGEKCPERERLEELRAAADQADAEYREEIARLRERLALWDACAQKTVEMYGGCVRPEYEQLLQDAAMSLAGLVRLTCAEREAVERARDSIASTMPYESRQAASDFRTLRGLLERLGGAK